MGLELAIPVINNIDFPLIDLSTVLSLIEIMSSYLILKNTVSHQTFNLFFIFNCFFFI